MPQRRDDGASHNYTYRGPARTLRLEPGGDPLGPGDKVTLTDRQVRALMRADHQFEPEGKEAEATIAAALEARRVERQRLEAEAAARKNAGQ